MTAVPEVVEGRSPQPLNAVRPRIRRDTRLKVGAYLLLALAAVYTLTPLAWIGLTSIKPPIDAYSLPPVWKFTPT